VRAISAALGTAGLVVSGPFVTTLVVGRTGVVPSVRWLALCGAVWLVAGGAAWIAAAGPWLQRVAPLAPLAVVVPLLVEAYAGDGAYHLLRGGASSAGAIVVLLFAGGIAWHAMRIPGRLGRPLRAADGEAAPERLSPWVVAPVTGLALMLGVNDALFEPLGTYRAGYGAWLVKGVAIAAVAGLCAAALSSRRVRLEPVAALMALLGGSVAVAGWVGIEPGAAVAPALAVMLLAPLVAGRFWSPFAPRSRRLAAGLAVVGCAAALTLPDRFGLGAREVAAVLPGATERVPLAGIAVLALILAGRAGVGEHQEGGERGERGGHTSRRAATGGTRAA
jgi:hypothetical protein